MAATTKSLNWTNDAYILDANLYEGDGYTKLADYANDNVAFTWYARNFSASTNEEDFNFFKGDFAAVWRDNYNYNINAYDDGQLVGYAKIQQDIKRFQLISSEKLLLELTAQSFWGRFKILTG